MAKVERDDLVQIPVTAAEKARLRKLADKHDMHMSEVVRGWIARGELAASVPATKRGE